MKRILAFFLVLSLLFCAGCGQASAPVQTEPVPLAETDLSGRYVLDPQRKEAIIDDAGQIGQQ